MSSAVRKWNRNYGSIGGKIRMATNPRRKRLANYIKAVRKSTRSWAGSSKVFRQGFGSALYRSKVVRPNFGSERGYTVKGFTIGPRDKRSDRRDIFKRGTPPTPISAKAAYSAVKSKYGIPGRGEAVRKSWATRKRVYGKSGRGAGGGKRKGGKGRKR